MSGPSAAVTSCELTTNPVLLGGENRSGTTLLSVILDSHPDLVVGPELDFTEPVNLGPHILAVCDYLDANEHLLVGATKETFAPSGTTGCILWFSVNASVSIVMKSEHR
ncbi:sulfotransferase [Lonsdalea britannica]|uniref:sulfotransferase n=1 Tax=Lonsdalea britannica TaxID=1082704 RepID=UPI001ABF8749|nr:sulfotransferase [Lonsdalea britannica]